MISRYDIIALLGIILIGAATYMAWGLEPLLMLVGTMLVVVGVLGALK